MSASTTATAAGRGDGPGGEPNARALPTTRPAHEPSAVAVPGDSLAKSRRQRPLEDWPLSADDLAEEERVLIASFQQAEMSVETINPEDAQRYLDGSDA